MLLFELMGWARIALQPDAGLVRKIVQTQIAQILSLSYHRLYFREVDIFQEAFAEIIEA